MGKHKAGDTEPPASSAKKSKKLAQLKSWGPSLSADGGTLLDIDNLIEEVESLLNGKSTKGIRRGARSKVPDMFFKSRSSARRTLAGAEAPLLPSANISCD
ncbi:hypothetical protein NDU88_000793 [Pleurodeles waltl]|uniref:Uncharacterized protein n=1 Tax=Pleurodeles waltl TaxID=8319 RepID=A0AAV7VYC4_PLEWA|nr:hypothetical protein NDU88_000793 [Pleurodeles waltl]